ncbi:hypothetical protein ANO11243_014930 [Dothideomycetidae sp. 11243]|nr:hypothetical protein ANO11243_014930 [fungal sp. No.11243]
MLDGWIEQRTCDDFVALPVITSMRFTKRCNWRFWICASPSRTCCCVTALRLIVCSPTSTASSRRPVGCGAACQDAGKAWLGLRAEGCACHAAPWLTATRLGNTGNTAIPAKCLAAPSAVREHQTLSRLSSSPDRQRVIRRKPSPPCKQEGRSICSPLSIARRIGRVGPLQTWELRLILAPLWPGLSLVGGLPRWLPYSWPIVRRSRSGPSAAAAAAAAVVVVVVVAVGSARGVIADAGRDSSNYFCPSPSTPPIFFFPASTALFISFRLHSL